MIVLDESEDGRPEPIMKALEPTQKRIISGPGHTDMTLPVGSDLMCRAVSDIFARLGDRWTLLVVVALRGRPRRFNDIKREVVGISQQMLTRTLKALERDGLLTRTVNDTSPPQVEYALSTLGVSLGETVRQLAQWAGRHRSTIEENRSQYDAGR